MSATSKLYILINIGALIYVMSILVSQLTLKKELKKDIIDEEKIIKNQIITISIAIFELAIAIALFITTKSYIQIFTSALWLSSTIMSYKTLNNFIELIEIEKDLKKHPILNNNQIPKLYNDSLYKVNTMKQK